MYSVSLKWQILGWRREGSFHAARDEYEIDLDLVCASKPGVLPPLAGERVVRHSRFRPRRDGDVVDA